MKIVLLFMILPALTMGGCSSSDSDDSNGNNENSTVDLQWLTRADPVTKFEYSQGICVRMIFYKNFMVTGGPGMVQLTATMKEYDGPAILDEMTDTISVQADQTYEAIVEVDVSSWGSCNPGFTESLVFSSPAATSSSKIDIYSFSDVDTGWFECAGNYSITDMYVQPYGGTNGTPVEGLWTGTSDFGEIEFEVSSDGNYIEKLKIIFVDFSCGIVASTSGSITFSKSPGWSISDGEFSMHVTLSQTQNREMDITGFFGNGGTDATGTYTADYDGTICQGAWEADSAN